MKFFAASAASVLSLSGCASAFVVSIRYLFPFNPLNEKEADEPFQDEFLSLKNDGADCSLFDFDSLDYKFNPKPLIQPNETIVYRGWMLPPRLYSKLSKRVAAKGGIPLTSAENYSKCHYLPGWYESCQDLTPETVFFPHTEDLREQIAALNWNCYFIKDFVKSNTAEGRGSIAESCEEAMELVNLIAAYRGEMEGGVAVRRVEDFVPHTEQRYFVLQNKVYSPNGKDKDIPELVQTVASRVDAPFYSVDTAMARDGTMRLVELGDGQVSDKKDWPLETFVQMLQSIRP